MAKGYVRADASLERRPKPQAQPQFIPASSAGGTGGGGGMVQIPRSDDPDEGPDGG
jgi:hypothetical protein